MYFDPSHFSCTGPYCALAPPEVYCYRLHGTLHCAGLLPPGYYLADTQVCGGVLEFTLRNDRGLALFAGLFALCLLAMPVSWLVGRILLLQHKLADLQAQKFVI